MVLTKAQRDATKSILNLVQHHKEDGRIIAEVFEQVPPKKDLPDYYVVIKKPIALDVIKSRARNGKYTAFGDFLRDLAQMFYNAKLYNVKRSLVYQDALVLERLINERVAKMYKANDCAEKELPTLGEIPEDSEDDDEEGEDAGSSDDNEDASATVNTSKSKRARTALRKEGSLGEDGTPLAHKKRGRPPKVESPNESRMKNIMRAVRRIQRNGETLFDAFEKLPNEKEYPDYFVQIRNPISLMQVKKNVKRKVYPSNNNIDPFIKDLKLVFENAQYFNEDDSEIYQDATYILGELDGIIESEVSKPDIDYTSAAIHETYDAESGGMVKLVRKGVDKILQRGEEYVVGDWVYLENTNDAKHPIIAQIFRTWQNSDGEYWMNVCWYYRPFQTVHRADKLWYEKEVVKTGQYRDHPANTLLGHCYIMYYTKYVRGRPKEWTGSEEDLWVCCDRYNEEIKAYNRIKAWKSCVPDEARETSSNYPLETFGNLTEPKKMLSPLLHLMPKDKKLWVNPSEEIAEKAPEPRDRGSISAPPIEGNIIVTAVPTEEELNTVNAEATRSVPKQLPTPVVAPTPQKAAVSAQQVPPQVSNPGTPAAIQTGPQTPYHPPPATAPTTNTNQTPSNSFQTQVQQIYARPLMPSRGPSTPGFSGNTAGYSRTNTTTTASRAINRGTPASTPYRPPMAQVATPVIPPPPVNTNKLNSLGSQINPTAMIFLDNLSMKEDLKRCFARDATDHVLWFTVPPQDSIRPAQEGAAVMHSLTYKAWKKRKTMAAAGAGAAAAADEQTDVVMVDS